MQVKKMTKTENKENQVREACGLFYAPAQYAKTELYEAQEQIHALMSWGLETRDADLMEACYKVAKAYQIKFGYAKEPETFCLREVQNLHDSVPGVIAKIRAEDQVAFNNKVEQGYALRIARLSLLEAD